MSDAPDGRPLDPSPSSELGCNPDHPREGVSTGERPNLQTRGANSDTGEEKWRQLFEQQNRNFMALVQAIKLPASSSSIRLPDFDPEKNDSDAHAWITTADMCVTDEHRQGPSLMIALSHALKGEASS